MNLSEASRRLFRQGGFLPVDDEAYRLHAKELEDNMYALCLPWLWDGHADVPADLKQDGDSPYVLVTPGNAPADAGGHAVADDRVLFVELPGKSLVRRKLAPMCSGADEVLIGGCESADGTFTIDYACGPATRGCRARTGTFDSSGAPQYTRTPYVVRKHYRSDGTLKMWRVLNDMLVPRDARDSVVYAAMLGPGGSLHRVWLRKGDRLVMTAEHDESGAKRIVRTGQMRTMMYIGPRGGERLVHCTLDPNVCQGAVEEWYAGPAGASYLVRRRYRDGRVLFYRGTTPQHVALRKVWYPDGRTQHYRGEVGREVPTAAGFEAREGGHADAAATRARDEGAGANVPCATTSTRDASDFAWMRGAFQRAAIAGAPAHSETATPTCYEGAIMCVNHTAKWTHVHGRLVVLESKVPETNEWRVSWVAAPAPRVPKGATCWSIAETHLVSETDYHAGQAARTAERATREAARRETLAARKRAAKEARRLQSDAKLAAALQADEEAAAAVPTPPPATKRPIALLVRCPLDGALLTEAVLAADGYVYNRTTLSTYWESAHRIASPITGASISAGVLIHHTLRSEARGIHDAGIHASGKDGMPTDEPELVLCPISHSTMITPVLAADGRVYDRASLLQWFGTGGTTSPLTGEEMDRTMRLDLHMAALCAPWA